jgi:hypothetical protein
MAGLVGDMNGEEGISGDATPRPRRVGGSTRGLVGSSRIQTYIGSSDAARGRQRWNRGRRAWHVACWVIRFAMLRPRSRGRGLRGAALGLAVASAAPTGLVASPALAADTWTTPHPGMRHLYRTTGDPLRIHALVMDLCAPGVSVRATKPGEKGKRPSAFGDLVNAEAAVNGDFYDLSSFIPTGMAMGQGEVWGGDDADWIGLVAF